MILLVIFLFLLPSLRIVGVVVVVLVLISVVNGDDDDGGAAKCSQIGENVGVYRHYICTLCVFSLPLLSPKHTH